MLDMAIDKTGVMHVKVRHRPRPLSDNSPGYVFNDLKEYLNKRDSEARESLFFVCG
jgi:hypothetical protein